MWAYAYQILPPQSRASLRTIRTLMDHEHATARAAMRLWTGRIVCGRGLTQILIVTDNLQLDHGINLRLETELGNLKVEFSISEPVLLPGNAAARARIGLTPHPKPM